MVVLVLVVVVLDLSWSSLHKWFGTTVGGKRLSYRDLRSKSTPVRYRFDVSSPVAVHEDLLVTGDSYQMGQSNQEPAYVVFGCSTGNYVLLMFRRLEVESAVAAGRLSIEGSPDQAKNFNLWFKGF